MRGRRRERAAGGAGFPGRATLGRPAPIAESPAALARETRLAAMLWKIQGRAAGERAAQDAGINRIAFIDASAAARRPALHVDVDEVMGVAQDARTDRGPSKAVPDEDDVPSGQMCKPSSRSHFEHLRADQRATVVRTRFHLGSVILGERVPFRLGHEGRIVSCVACLESLR
jgi:hypothetical protein